MVLGECGTIDTEDIREYFAVDGFPALATSLQDLCPEQVIEIVEDSGLQGRSGGGFPAGRKWKAGRKAKATPKYVVCNREEGDSGAFMDRSVLEANPQSVIEGVTIAAYASGLNSVLVYVRAEYPLAVVELLKAIEQANEYGVLGDNIMGSGFNFEIEVSGRRRLRLRRIHRPDPVDRRKPRNAAGSSPSKNHRGRAFTTNRPCSTTLNHSLMFLTL